MASLDKLKQNLRRRGPLCIGLDPDEERMPPSYQGRAADFLVAIVKATSDLVGAYKINTAFFEAAGLDGWRALDKVVRVIPRDAFLILDAKRGDIENANRHYARSLFETWGADAVTVHPYLGLEPLEPFFSYTDRLTFVLCATTEGGYMQELEIEGMPLYMWVAKKVAARSQGQCGLVIGATREEALHRVRDALPDLPLLVPGVGTQGGAVPRQPALVSVSRAILYASAASNFLTAARRSAEEYARACAAI